MTCRTNIAALRARPALAAAGVAQLLLAGLLAGCATGPTQPLGPERTSEAPNAIEVAITHRSLAVHFEPGDSVPRPKDVAALNVLLATGDIAPGDTVRIERAPGPIADVRARGLAGALTRQGLRPILAAPGGAPDDQLLLVVEHATTSVPNCPNWTKPPGNDLANTLHSDFGCASAIDLAAMVADPRDLVEGRPLAPVVGDAAIWPINRYRTGMPENGPATAQQPFIGATTAMATAAAGAQAQAGAADRPPAGATSDPGAAGRAVAAAQAAGAAGAAAGVAPGVSGGQP